MPKTPKHVIFLGAGASASSGFPLAEDLKKKWLSSESNFREQLWLEYKESFSDNENHPEWREAQKLFVEILYPRVGGDLILFREGGFGTIDEFCYHLRESKNIAGDRVKELKNALRVVFGMHSPERHFSKSDYYSFLQKLFLPENLTKLNDELVILSYNYDIYLEWLLERAVCRRVQSIGGNSISALAEVRSSISSGFVSTQGGLTQMIEADKFCLLKLHGMVAWPENISSPETSHHPYCCFDDFFDFSVSRKMKKLSSAVDSQAPIIFPWELITPDGQFISEDQFAIKDEVFSVGYRDGPARTSNSPSLYEIYKAIWTRAREEVQAADKISFVGLSMHPYLEFGFRYLFKDRKDKLSLSITDRRSVGEKFPLPTSPTGRLTTLLDKLKLQHSPIRVRQDFADFIEKELL